MSKKELKREVEITFQLITAALEWARPGPPSYPVCCRLIAAAQVFEAHVLEMMRPPKRKRRKRALAKAKAKAEA